MPLGALDAREALAVGIALSTDRTHARMQLTKVAQTSEAAPLTHAFGQALREGWRTNPAVHALPMLEHLHALRGGDVTLAHGVNAPFAITLQPVT